MGILNLDLLNGRSRRMLGIRPLMAMVLATTAVSLAVQHPVSAAAQDGLRIKNVASATAKPTQADEPQFLVRTARVPIFVDIALGAASGTPAVPDDAVDRVVAALDANPRRLITLRFKGVALRFSDLTRSTREALLDKKGNEVIDAYNGYMAGQVRRLIGDVDAARAGAPIAVQGIPFEGGTIEVASANRAYRPVIDRLNAIVVAGGMMLSGSSDEVGMLRRSYPQAIAASDNRAIMFAANGGWKIATFTDGDHDVEGSVADAASELADLASDEPHAVDLAADVDAVNGSAILGSIASADVASAGRVERLGSQGNHAGEGSANSRVGPLPSRGGSGNGRIAGGLAATIDGEEEGSEGAPDSSTQDETNSDTWPESGSVAEQSGDSDGEEGEASGDASSEDNGQSGDPTEVGWDAEDEVDDVGDSAGDPNDGSAEPNEGGLDESGGSDGSGAGADSELGYTDWCGHDDGVSQASLPRPTSETWASWDSLRQQVEDAPDGSVIDLGGQQFRMNPDSQPIKIRTAVTIKNGIFSAAAAVDWEEESPGLYRAENPNRENTNLFFYLEDFSASAPPRLAVLPRADSADERSYPLAVNDDWIVIQDTTQGRSIDNGTVLTTLGPNGEGAAGRITGFQITSPEIKAWFDLAYSQAGGYLTINYLAGQNHTLLAVVSSWNPADGTVTLENLAEQLHYSGYFRFSIYSPPPLLNPGEYTICGVRGLVWYRPESGSAAAASLPITTCLFNVLAPSARFERCAFFSAGGPETGGAMVVSYQNPPPVVEMEKCLFQDGKAASSGCVLKFLHVLIARMSKRGVNCYSGSEFLDSRFEGMEELSAIMCFEPPGWPSHELVPRTVVEGCFFEMPAATHGQAVSLYRNSWQNAVVSENLFFNATRAISWSGPGASGNQVGGRLQIENNLVVADHVIGVLGGMATVCGLVADSAITIGQQAVELRYNSFLGYHDLPASFGVDLHRLGISAIAVEGNIASGITAARSEDGALPQWRASNLIGESTRWINPLNAWAATDLRQDELGALNIDQLQPEGVYATAASDGGCVGVRWQYVPHRSYFSGLRLDWREPANIDQLPPHGTLAAVFGGEDNR